MSAYPRGEGKNMMNSIVKSMARVLLMVAVIGTGWSLSANPTDGQLAGGEAIAISEKTSHGWPQEASGTTTPHGWYLTPAGTQLPLGDFPIGGAISPDHRYLVVSNDGEGTQSLQVVDIERQTTVQTIPYEKPESLFLGIAFNSDGRKLYASASGNDKIRVFDFDNGTLAERSPILMQNPKRESFFPQGISVSPDGKFLYTANNANNSASRIDLATGRIIATTRVGNDPYTTLLSRDGETLYVSNWGESSVSVLNAEDMTVSRTIPVGLHPNALAENPANGLVYVANGDSDEISVIDPSRLQVTQTISLSPYPDAPTGSVPNALTVSPDGKTLYVANAGNNDIAVVDLGIEIGTVQPAVAVKGLIPTAWYPTGVYLTDGKLLMVLNAKGMGAGPNSGHQYIGDMIKGTMSFIDVPDDRQLQNYTRQVKDNNRMADMKNGGWFGGLQAEKKNDSPIPRYSGQETPIKHVIFVIKENRTYDQVFGDLEKGNGEPSLTEFGAAITPNLHKLASQFVTLDNFYADGEVSEQGHRWVIQAESNDYTEKNWPQEYSERKAESDGEATKVKQGYLWSNAQQFGVSFRNYGENVWFDEKSGISVPNDPGMGDHLDPQYPGWSFAISDVQRVREWAKEFRQFEANGSLPQLEMVYLPNDHTEGTAPGHPTPQAYVAQNDYALGILVDTVSHSKYWKDTAIFVTEDDAQDGADHVDAHREEALVISPYTQTSTVDSTMYDQMSMYHTIEMILGMKPMTQFDASAIPMLNSFTEHPNLAAYDAVQPSYSLDERNGPNAPMAEVSSQLDFTQADSADKAKLNLAIWKATKGDQPYPGNNS